MSINQSIHSNVNANLSTYLIQKEMEEHLSSFQKAWTENQGVLDFEVKEVYLISRTATDPFEVRAVIPLGSGKG